MYRELRMPYEYDLIISNTFGYDLTKSDKIEMSNLPMRQNSYDKDEKYIKFRERIGFDKIYEAFIPIAFDDSKIISHKDFVYIFRKFISGMHGENRFKNTIHMFDK